MKVCWKAGLVLACLLWQAAGADAGKQYGEKLLNSYQLDAATIQRIADFKPSAKGDGGIVGSLLADSVDWRGPVMPVIALENPHTLVVRVLGRTRADGPATSLWLGGWEVSGGDNSDDKDFRTPIAGLNALNAKAGEAFEVVAAGGPVSFKTSRNANPLLSFVRSDNMHIDRVTVEVWSGMAPTPGSALFLSSPALWIGVVMLALWWFWFRR